jgi:hypothetical protein
MAAGHVLSVSFEVLTRTIRRSLRGAKDLTGLSKSLGASRSLPAEPALFLDDPLFLRYQR